MIVQTKKIKQQQDTGRVIYHGMLNNLVYLVGVTSFGKPI
jgi:hypothetical protein